MPEGKWRFLPLAVGWSTVWLLALAVSGRSVCCLFGPTVGWLDLLLATRTGLVIDLLLIVRCSRWWTILLRRSPSLFCVTRCYFLFCLNIGFCHTVVIIMYMCVWTVLLQWGHLSPLLFILFMNTININI